MNTALVVSESSLSPRIVLLGRVEATTLGSINQLALSGVVWSSESQGGAAYQARLLARIEELEQRLADSEHLRSVRKATIASAASFLSAWDDGPPEPNEP